MSHMPSSLRAPQRESAPTSSPVVVAWPPSLSRALPGALPAPRPGPDAGSWSRAAERAAAVRDAAGDAVMIGLALAQSAGAAAIILSALGWRLVG